jgi:hypothetical protein
LNAPPPILDLDLTPSKSTLDVVDVESSHF